MDEFNYDKMTGFSSPCLEFAEDEISLDREYLSNKASTYIIQVDNEAKHLGIQKHDRFLIDRSLNPKEGSLVLAVINNEFTIRRFTPTLIHHNDIESGDFIWGVVTAQIRKHL